MLNTSFEFWDYFIFGAYNDYRRGIVGVKR